MKTIAIYAGVTLLVVSAVIIGAVIATAGTIADSLDR